MTYPQTALRSMFSPGWHVVVTGLPKQDPRALWVSESSSMNRWDLNISGVPSGFAILWSSLQGRSVCPGITIIGFGPIPHKYQGTTVYGGPSGRA